MNVNSEQIQFDCSIVLAQDQPLNSDGIYGSLVRCLGEENMSICDILGKNVFVFNSGEKKIILLTKAITYLGNPHPVFKKRIQLPQWYQSFCESQMIADCGYDVRFLGVYQYDGNVIFVDFLKDTYLQHGLHNSSAHVYINDLYQAMTYGIFKKEDKFGNTLVAVRNDKIKDYLEGTGILQTDLLSLFAQFNAGYPFGQWLHALNIIQEMHKGQWPNWKQAEWAGWFLEFEFDKFIQKYNLESHIRYTGTSNKKSGELDFDIYFEESDFYGDLKASDISKKETPGNDQRTLVECIYRYNKFWYVIYEHETQKDSDNNYEATKARNKYIKSVDPAYDKDEMSYSSRMKHSVKFTKMTIIELNRVNYRDALKDFNQGRQADGNVRTPKFNINKKVLSNDNYVVFRYTYK